VSRLVGLLIVILMKLASWCKIARDSLLPGQQLDSQGLVDLSISSGIYIAMGATCLCHTLMIKNPPVKRMRYSFRDMTDMCLLTHAARVNTKLGGALWVLPAVCRLPLQMLYCGGFKLKRCSKMTQNIIKTGQERIIYRIFPNLPRVNNVFCPLA
jgi:hypothetical protein